MHILDKMYEAVPEAYELSQFAPRIISIQINPEKQLTDVLTKKYGKRFSDYREEYFKILNSPKENYNYIPDYPLNVLVEVVNKCNLEFIMCLSSHRKGPTKVITDETISKLFIFAKVRRMSCDMEETFEILYGFEKIFFFKQFQNYSFLQKCDV